MNLNETGLVRQYIKKKDNLYSIMFATEFLPVSSPAVLGLVKPPILLPQGLQDWSAEIKSSAVCTNLGCQQQGGESWKVEIKSQESTSTLLLESPNSCRQENIEGWEKA